MRVEVTRRTNPNPRSHDTSRIACAKVMARVGEEFPLLCPFPRRRHSADHIDAQAAVQTASRNRARGSLVRFRGSDQHPQCGLRSRRCLIDRSSPVE